MINSKSLYELLVDFYVRRRASQLVQSMPAGKALHRAIMETIRGNLIDLDVVSERHDYSGPEKPWKI